jgi:DNA polymerase III subunit alpha
MSYISLHNHTRRGSNFDGDIDVQKLVQYSKGKNLPAACITDHGSMSAAFELFKECKKAGIKHLIGCELYVMEENGEKTPKGKDYYHLTAIAINLEGYKNLCRLSTIASLEQIHGKAKKPCVTNAQIFKYNEGLVILSGCISSELNQSLSVEDELRAKKLILKYRAVFKERLYLELHCHYGIRKSWPSHTQKIVELGKKLNVPRIITNDAHFLGKEDWFSQTLALSIGLKGNATLGSERLNNFEYTGEEYVKSRDEIFQHFFENSGLSEDEINNALNATLDISDKFEDYSLFNVVKPIKFSPNAEAIFKQKCADGMFKRYSHVSPGTEELNKLWERLDYEMRVISEMGFSDYFLIVEDFCSYVRSIGHKVGKGRGSAAGSIVAYCLGITDIDPIKHGLMFERFLNPSRVSMPDIDTDMDGEGKDKVVEHLRQRWGRYNVAAVGTITKSAAGSALADAFRTHNLSWRKATDISKRYFKTVRGVPPKISKLLVDEGGEFYKFFHSEELSEEERVAINHAAQYIEGRERQSGVHAGGICISEELQDFVPLVWDGGEEKITTVYDKDELEEMGVIKFDVLGLTGLSQELEIESLLKENNFAIPVINELGNYPEVYAMLKKGDTFGVFQMEGKVPSNLLREIGANNFEDLSAVNALNRPGCLDSGSDRVYVKNRVLGTPKVHPIVDEVLKDTFGIMLYQEEIMLMAQKLSGYSLAEADDLRKIIGKKKIKDMPLQQEKFVGGAITHSGVSEELALALWAEVKASAEYSFNKSHTYAYGYQALISAFYKVYAPREFWAAGITVSSKSFEKSAEWIKNAKRHFNIILPKMWGELRVKCFLTAEGINLGLANIKGLGVSVAEEIVKNYPYNGVVDFCLRSGGDKGVVISLNNLGFFGDEIFPEESLAVLFKALSYFKGTLKKKALKNNLNGEVILNVEEFKTYLVSKDFDFPQPTLRKIEKIIEVEKELIGAVVSVNPFQGLNLNLPQNEWVVGIVTNYKPHTTKRGDLMVFLMVEDENGVGHDITVFNEELTAFNTIIQSSVLEYKPLAFNVTKGEYNGKVSNTCKAVLHLSEVKKHLDVLNSIAAFEGEYGDRIASGKIIQNKILTNKQTGGTDHFLRILQKDGCVLEVFLRDGTRGKEFLTSCLTAGITANLSDGDKPKVLEMTILGYEFQNCQTDVEEYPQAAPAGFW